MARKCIFLQFVVCCLFGRESSIFRASSFDALVGWKQLYTASVCRFTIHISIKRGLVESLLSVHFMRLRRLFSAKTGFSSALPFNPICIQGLSRGFKKFLNFQRSAKIARKKSGEGEKSFFSPQTERFIPWKVAIFVAAGCKKKKRFAPKSPKKEDVV